MLFIPAAHIVKKTHTRSCQIIETIAKQMAICLVYMRSRSSRADRSIVLFVSIYNYLPYRPDPPWYKLTLRYRVYFQSFTVVSVYVRVSLLVPAGHVLGQVRDRVWLKLPRYFLSAFVPSPCWS